jgi:ABC-type sulfate/molybdate transport systems ATPase subunit
MDRAVSHPFRALDRAVSQAFRARLSATLSGYPVISVMEALQGLNPPA